MLKVKKPILFLLAGILWLAAGVNILRIGIESMISVFKPAKLLTWILVGAALLVFTGFHFMFTAMVRRHKKRILGYEEKVSVFRFMDVKGYLIMAFMMGLGITLRVFAKLPTKFFASFYNGLGAALSVAGIRFLWMIVTWKRTTSDSAVA
ncbi:MAG: hypothetical protein IJX76_08590 [Clostridia bacterium]|nr:hypothetical protein [Clostridia bacterium]